MERAHETESEHAGRLVFKHDGHTWNGLSVCVKNREVRRWQSDCAESVLGIL